MSATALSPINQRRIAAVVGAIVGDAAAQPLHWIYNIGKLKALTDGLEEVEFRYPSANPFYRIPTGSNSCYGDQAFVMLKSLVDSQGLCIDNLKQETYKAFGPESPYENKENSRYVVGKEDKVNVKKTLPINGPWRMQCIKEFLANMESGIDETGSPMDDQIDCAIRIIPLVSLYAGHPDLLAQVERGLCVTQASDLTITSSLAFARILEQYILQEDPGDVLQTAVDAINSSDNPHPQEFDKSVVAQIRRVLQVREIPHAVAVPKYFKNN